MKKLLALIVCLAIFLTGCWDLDDVESLAVVSIMGIDQAPNNQIKLVIHESKPKSVSGEAQGGGAEKIPFNVFIGTGTSLFEIIRALSAVTPQRLFFTHTQVIVISEELARTKGISDIMDFLERNEEIRRSTWVLVAKKGQFMAVLTKNFNLDTDNGQILANLIKHQDINTLYEAKRLGDIISLIAGEEEAAVTAGVVLQPESIENNQNEAGSKLAVMDTALFKKDKLVGWMNGQESRGVLWVQGKVKGGIVQCSLKNKPLALEILRASSKVKPEIKDGKIKMNIEIKVSADVGEVQTKLDLRKKESIEQIKEKASEEVKREIMAAYDRSKEMHVDAFGFARQVHGYYPDQWRQIKNNWDDYYADLELNIKVEPEIPRFGLITENISQ